MEDAPQYRPEEDHRTLMALRQRMSAGYAPEQATWILRTARMLPGVRVAFDSADGGRQHVSWDEVTVAYWLG